MVSLDTEFGPVYLIVCVNDPIPPVEVRSKRKHNGFFLGLEGNLALDKIKFASNVLILFDRNCFNNRF